jgi:hypothetical protein
MAHWSSCSAFLIGATMPVSSRGTLQALFIQVGVNYGLASWAQALPAKHPGHLALELQL